MITTWISAISIAVAALTSVLNLVVMGSLTRTIHRLSARTAELEILRRNSDQWQRLNLAFIGSPGLQRVLDAENPATDEERDIQRNLLFYVLNTLHEVYQAQATGLVGTDIAMRLMRGQIAILKPHAAAVTTLLTGHRGYELDFCAFVKAELAGF